MVETIESILSKVENLIIRQKSKPEKPIELTDDDKFVIAFVAGVEMRFEQDCDEVKAITIPCNVIWDGEKFRVFVRP